MQWTLLHELNEEMILPMQNRMSPKLRRQFYRRGMLESTWATIMKDHEKARIKSVHRSLIRISARKLLDSMSKKETLEQIVAKSTNKKRIGKVLLKSSMLAKMKKKKKLSIASKPSASSKPSMIAKPSVKKKADKKAVMKKTEKSSKLEFKAVKKDIERQTPGPALRPAKPSGTSRPHVRQQIQAGLPRVAAALHKAQVRQHAVHGLNAVRRAQDGQPVAPAAHHVHADVPRPSGTPAP